MSLEGKGWVQIVPAALYDPPVFAQVLSLLSARPAQPGDPAFKHAYGDFEIANGQFNFSKIKLAGDSLALGGVGTVGFAGQQYGRLNLDFLTKMSRQGFMRPLAPLGDDMIRVQVLGTVDRPIATVQPRIKFLDELFAPFMQAPAPPPRRDVPQPAGRPTGPRP